MATFLGMGVAGGSGRAAGGDRTCLATSHWALATIYCPFAIRYGIPATRCPGSAGRGRLPFLAIDRERVNVRPCGDRRGFGWSERGDGGRTGRRPGGAGREGAIGG